MSADSIQVVSVRVQNSEFSGENGNEYKTLPADYGFDDTLQSNIRTLSTRHAPVESGIIGFLYTPTLDSAQNASCPEASNTTYIPRNVTHFDRLPKNSQVIALAPWINTNCALAFLQAAAKQPILEGMLFYLPNNGTGEPPKESDPIWAIDQDGEWKNDFDFPVYAVPGQVGNLWMQELAFYSGNVSGLPRVNDLIQDGFLTPVDFVRLVANISTGGGGGIPALWVFLLMVAGILILIIGATSCVMQCLARRRRATLRRRVAEGQVDLEALGIKRLRVPQEVLDKMPLYTYTGPAPSAPTTPAIETPAPVADVSAVPARQRSRELGKEVGVSTASVPTTMFSQQTCAICLDDFTPGSAAPSRHSRSSTSAIRSATSPNTTYLPEIQVQTASPTFAEQSAVKEVGSVETEAPGPSLVRELPCGHIFHAECVDPFLTTHSSLCPLCKKSSLPIGFVPRDITNTMVRRERQVRNLRGRGIRVESGSGPDIARGSIAAAAAYARSGAPPYGSPMERMWERRPRLGLPSRLRRSSVADEQGSEMQRMRHPAAPQPTTATSLAGVGEARAAGRVQQGVPAAGVSVPVLVQQSHAEDEEEHAHASKPWWRRTAERMFPTA